MGTNGGRGKHIVVGGDACGVRNLKVLDSSVLYRHSSLLRHEIQIVSHRKCDLIGGTVIVKCYKAVIGVISRIVIPYYKVARPSRARARIHKGVDLPWFKLKVGGVPKTAGVGQRYMEYGITRTVDIHVTRINHILTIYQLSLR